MSATTSAATGRCFGIQRVCRSGSARARRSTRGGRGHTTGWARGRRGGGRRRGNRTRSCWRRFGPISRGPRSTAKAIARSTHGCRPHAGAARHAGDCSPRTAGEGAAKTHDGRVITQAPNVMWGTDGVRVFTLDDGWGSSRQSNTGTRSAWGGRVQSRDRAQGPNGSMARWTPTSPVGWRFGWITVVSTCQTTSSSRSGRHPSFGFVEEPETNGVAERWVRSRSKRSTAESFRTSRPSAPPWPTSWSGTTRPGVSRSLGITRRSRRARSMSYARRHSINVCPGNRVRYTLGRPVCLRKARGCFRHYAAELGRALNGVGRRDRPDASRHRGDPCSLGRGDRFRAWDDGGA